MSPNNNKISNAEGLEEETVLLIRDFSRRRSKIRVPVYCELEILD